MRTPACLAALSPGADSDCAEAEGDLSSTALGVALDFLPQDFPAAEKPAASSVELLPILQDSPPICPAQTNSPLPALQHFGHQQHCMHITWLGISCLLPLPSAPLRPVAGPQVLEEHGANSCISVSPRAPRSGPSVWEWLCVCEAGHITTLTDPPPAMSSHEGIP